MKLKIQYTTKEERQNILDLNKEKYLIEEQNHLNNENYLIFTDIKPLDLQLNDIKNNTDLIILKQEGII